VAETNAITGAYAVVIRKVAIKNNIRLALERLTNSSADWIDRCMEEIDAKRVDAIGFYGYTYYGGQKKRVIQLLVSVDWSLHEKFTLELGNEVRIRNMGGLSNGLVPETNAAINIFDDCTKEMRLDTHFFVTIASSLPQDVRNRCTKKLGLTGSAPPWVEGSKNVIGTYSAKELQELTSEITVVG